MALRGVRYGGMIMRRDRRIIECRSCGYNVIVSGSHADCLSCGWGHAVAHHTTRPLREEDYVPGLRTLTYRDEANMNEPVRKFCGRCGSPIRKTNRETGEGCENCI